MEKIASGAMATRQALVSTALRLFGAHGYDAVSTRQIADEAKANIGSIAYHFGGKPGLRTACAHHVSSAVQQALAPEFPAEVPEDLGPQAAGDMLIAVITTFVMHATQSPDSDEVSAFVMREMMSRGEVMQHIYREIIGPVHERLCQLFTIATGRTGPEDEISIIVFSLVGQAMYFRMSKEMVVTRMNWSNIGTSETAMIVDVLKANMRALLEYYRADSPELMRAHG